MMSDTIQPGRQRFAIANGCRLASQVNKHRLGNILRQGRLPNHSQSRGIDQINMAPGEFGKCAFGLALHVVCEQFRVVHVCRLFNQ